MSEERQSNTETNLTENNSGQIGWVTFDEPDINEPQCLKSVDREQICPQKGQYIARLGESQKFYLLNYCGSKTDSQPKKSSKIVRLPYISRRKKCSVILETIQ